MNHLQSLDADRPFCVTLNRTAAIDPEQVIRVIPYAHPIFTRAATAAQDRHAEISGVERTHYWAPTGAGASTRTAWPARTRRSRGCAPAERWPRPRPTR